MRFFIEKIHFPSLWRFSITGVINTAIDFVVFFTLHLVFGLAIIPANIISFTIAIVNSYLLNKYWSFKHVDSGFFRLSQFLFFVLVSVFSLFLNTAILVYGEPFAPLLLLKIIGAVIVPLTNYLTYRFVIFRPQPGD